MALILPTPQGDIDTWGDELSAALTLIDAHDHSTGHGVPIGVAGIAIAGDLTFGGNSAVHLKSADFDEVTALAAGARRLFWSSADHELYVRTAAGANVKITNGAGLNLSLVGGIVGDYAAVGAEVAYDDANDRYTFKQQVGALVRQWARLDGADLDLYEYKPSGDVTNIVNRVRLSSPAALAASYAMTMPAALPGSTVALQLSSAGAITASNTFANAVTLTGGIANNVTLSNGATLASGKTLDTTAGSIAAAAIATTTVTASADIKHSFTHKLGLPAGLWQVVGSPAAVISTGIGIALSTHTGSATVPTATCGIPLKQNDQITRVDVYVDKLSGAGTVTARVKSYDPLTGTTIDIGHTAWTVGNTILVTGLTTTVVSNVAYWVQIEGGGTTGDAVYHASVSYVRP